MNWAYRNIPTTKIVLEIVELTFFNYVKISKEDYNLYVQLSTIEFHLQEILRLRQSGI